MVETIQKNNVWTPDLVKRDLVEQAKLNPNDFNLYRNPNMFRYKERLVSFSHTFDQKLAVSVEGLEDSDSKILMESFSKVVGYEPFCKYVSNPTRSSFPFFTQEWNKSNPDKRFNELCSQANVSNLTEI